MVSKVWEKGGMVIKVKSGRKRRDGQLSKVWEKQEGWSIKKSLGERGGVVSKVKSGGERRDGQ